MAIVVYGIECVVNGFTYVGCMQVRRNRRMNEHMSLLRKGKHAATKMVADWNAYGREAFVMKVIEKLQDDVSLPDKRAAELKWMDHFKAIGKLYNEVLISYGPGPRAAIMTGTPEAREKRSKAMKGKPKHPGHGAKVSATKRRLGQRPTLEAARRGNLAAQRTRYGKD